MLLSLTLVTAAMVSDVRSERIPNSWICAGLAAALLCRLLSWTPFGWGWMCLGMLIPFLICWVPFRMGAMGAGDVKLLMVLGALNGGQQIFCCIFFSFLLAAGISLGRLLSLRRLKDSLFQLFLYFKNIFLCGRIEAYQGRHSDGHTIHFAVAVFFGYTAWLGVNVCRAILLS